MVMISVSVAPSVQYDSRYSGAVEVKAGSTLILPVNFTGSPSPRVRWYRNGVPLLPIPGHVHIDTGDMFSTLTVMGIEVEEAGRFSVQVDNLAGTQSADFNVGVKCKHFTSDKHAEFALSSSCHHNSYTITISVYIILYVFLYIGI